MTEVEDTGGSIADTSGFLGRLGENRSRALPILFSIWPVAEAIAKCLAVGDLIALSRTNSDLRTSLHGGLLDNQPRLRSEYKNILYPPIGQHQTPHWINLKSLGQFVCSSRTHTKGEKTKGCVYCSQPICEACIVRDSFKHRNENTFRNRFRYLCERCWSEGRPVKRFRYKSKVSSIGRTSSPASSSSSESASEDSASSLGSMCDCTLKDNGWLCLDCKKEQNSSPCAVGHLHTSGVVTGQVECYGLSCKTLIDLSGTDRDKRRICLWCENPLKRNYTSLDCYRHHARFSEWCAANALSRTQDMQEYNHDRARSLRMSLCEFRGLAEVENDTLDLVRHLDTTNYRNFISDSACPTPDQVFDSKRGQWRYGRPFLIAVGRRCRQVDSKKVMGKEATDSIASVSQSESLSFARTNLELDGKSTLWLLTPSLKLYSTSDQHEKLKILRTRILNMCLSPTNENYDDKQKEMSLASMRAALNDQYGISVSTEAFKKKLGNWLKEVELQQYNLSDSSNGGKLTYPFPRKRSLSQTVSPAGDNKTPQFRQLQDRISELCLEADDQDENENENENENKTQDKKENNRRHYSEGCTASPNSTDEAMSSNLTATSNTGNDNNDDNNNNMDIDDSTVDSNIEEDEDRLVALGQIPLSATIHPPML